MNSTTPPNGKTRDVRETARRLRRGGHFPIPLPPRSKKPVGEAWTEWRIDEDEIDEKFAADSNVGVLLGDPSGDVDVDLDSPEAIAAAPFFLPATDMISGRQSAPTSHWWYVVDEPPKRAAEKFSDPTTADRKKALLLELRSTGGQTLVPPSVYPADPADGHPTAEACVWHRSGDPARVCVKELHAAVSRVASAALVARHWPGGARHDASLALAGGLLRAGWPDAEVEAFVSAVCAAGGDTEVRDRVTAVRTSAERLRNGENASGWPSLERMLGAAGPAAVNQVRTWLKVKRDPKSATTGDGGSGTSKPAPEWPAPIPLTIAPDVPRYPVDVLSPWLRQWAEAVAVELQVPVDLPAGLGLGLVAAGIARKVVVSPRVGFTEPTNLFVMVALPPGDRKTQTFRRAIAPVQRLQREAREEAKPKILEAESEQRIAEKRVKHIEDKISKADPAEREQLQEDLKEAREELARAEVPPLPVLYTEDDTPESLKLELIRQGGRMVVASTEARCLENITLYNDKPNFDVYLKGHAGDEMNSGRVSRGRDMVTDPALSCLLSPQPALLQGLAEDEILRGRGFLARWMYALPESRVGTRAVAAPPVPPAVLDEYERLIRAAWAVEYGESEAGEPAHHVLRFAPEAAAEFEAFERWVEPQLAPGQPLARLAGWTNKLNGACARVAAALHVADALGAGGDWTEPISLAVVRRALRLCRDYQIAHAVAAFDLMGANVVLSRARKVWGWVTSNKLTEFSRRDCFRAMRAVFETVDDLQPCLELLERHYLVRAREQQAAGRGRPASPVYDVNPHPGGGDDFPVPNAPPTPPPNSVNCVQRTESSTGGISPLTGEADSQTAGQEVRTQMPEMAESVPPPNSVNCVQRTEPAAPYTLVTAAAGLSDVVTAIEDGGGPIGLDTETSGLNPGRDRVRLIQLATARGTFLIDVFKFPHPRTELAEVFEVLARAGVCGHNLAFDLSFLARLGFVPGRVADTMLASQVLHAGDFRVRHGLKDVAARVLNVTLDKTEQKADWSKALTPEMLAYAARDAETPVAAWAELKTQADAARLAGVLDAEMAAVPAVAWASSKGVGFDRAAWEALAAEAGRKQDEVRERLDAAAPAHNLTGSRNWNANAEVVAALASVGVTVTGTDDDTLAGIDHPIAVLMREYRGLAKLVGTYGKKWLENVAADGRVYASWRQLGAEATGRMSCKEPNLQQLPRDNRYRKCFVAPPGRTLVKADYSQIELRIAARLTGDKRMLAAYRDNVDVHTMTARALLGKEEVSKADRQLAKAVNFGLLYGQGAKGLMAYALGSYGVTLTEAEASAHRETFFKTYAGLRTWHRKVRGEIQAKFDADPDAVHDVRTLGRRRRLLPVAKKPAGREPYPNITEALNTPVQGTGADGLKAALALLWERRDRCPDAFPVLFVHDEVVVECDEDKADAAVAWVKAAMVDGMAPLIAPVAVEVEATVGRTWGG